MEESHVSHSPGHNGANVIVLGRFPPPVDGQSLATARLATLLDKHVPLFRIDTEWAEESPVRSTLPVLRRATHFLRLRAVLRQKLPTIEKATVLWPAISPDVAGHVRDLAVTLPAIQRFDPVFAVVHRGNFDRLFVSHLTRRTGRRVLRRISGFVFLTRQLAEKCAKWIPEEKRIVIPNTIDDELLFSESEIEQKRVNRRLKAPFTVLFVGHMLPSKGYIDVLDAVHRAHLRAEDIRAHFVGGWQKDAARVDFARRVEQLDLGTAVSHHGPLSDRAAIKSLYAKADVLMLPSYYRNEAQPLVILEALNAGVPVISTHHAGIPELVTHEREGLLVSSRDPRALECAMSHMREPHTWMEMSQAARKKFLMEFSPEVVREKWLALVHRRTG